jgi:hypothetical protein
MTERDTLATEVDALKRLQAAAGPPSSDSSVAWLDALLSDRLDRAFKGGP